MTALVSRLATDIEAFLAFKRALGYRYWRAEFHLHSLDRFLAARDRAGARPALDQAVLAWLADRPGRKPVSVAGEVSLLREFFVFLRRRGRRVREPCWPRLPNTSRYVPHVLSVQDIRRLLRLTRTLRWPVFRETMYRTLLLVLYCTGLRFGEAVRLRLRDVDIVAGTLFVAESKGRARWIPIHRSLCRVLKRYLCARLAVVGRACPDDGLFVRGDGVAVTVKTASTTVRQLLVAAGLKPAKGRAGPRPYDLRHTFAVHRLTRWYRAGVDLHARLPWLSAYMGHDDILGTETYLSATPELLALASDRFRRRYLAAEAQP